MKSSKFTSTPLFPRQALVALLLPVQQPPQQVLLVVLPLFWDSALLESLLGLLLLV